MNSFSKACMAIAASILMLGANGCSGRKPQTETAAANSSQARNTQAQEPPAGNPPTSAQPQAGDALTPSSAPQNAGTAAPPPAVAAQHEGAVPPSGALASQHTGSAEPAAPSTQAHVAQAPPPPPPPPKRKTFEVPAGTNIAIRTTTEMSTKTVKTGDPFEASLSSSLVVAGVVIAPKGATASGVVANSDPGGRVKGVASLSLQIRSIRSADGQTLQVQTKPTVNEANSSKKRDAVRTGIGAGAGAAIGAIAGGGKGAAIGAGIGGGAGVVTNLVTRGKAAVLPAESVVQFKLADGVSITEKQPGSLTKKASAHL